MLSRLTLQQCREELAEGPVVPNDIHLARKLVKIHRTEKLVQTKNYKETIEFYAGCSEEELLNYAVWRSIEIDGRQIMDVYIDRWYDSAAADTIIQFGKHAGRTYAEVQTLDREYCNWVLQTSLSSQTGEDLCRFSRWLYITQTNHQPNVSDELIRLQREFQALSEAYQTLAGDPWTFVA